VVAQALVATEDLNTSIFPVFNVLFM